MSVEAVSVGPCGWRRWRALRLAALADAPAAFSSTLAQWSGTGDTEARWRARLASGPHNLVLVRGGTDVGMVGLAASEGTDPPELVSMWVAAEARGTGVADAALEAVLARAAEAYPGRGVALSVYEDDVAALRLYARHGFVDVGVSPDSDRERRMLRVPDGLHG